MQDQFKKFQFLKRKRRGGNNFEVSQLDIVADESRMRHIGGIEWYITVPMSSLFVAKDLPKKGTTEQQIYEIAREKSLMRQSLGALVADDGKYCPIDHIATRFTEVELCPLCGRELLCFGWD